MPIGFGLIIYKHTFIIGITRFSPVWGVVAKATEGGWTNRSTDRLCLCRLWGQPSPPLCGPPLRWRGIFKQFDLLDKKHPE